MHRIRYGAVDLGDLPEAETREIPPDSPEGAWAQRLLAGGRPKGDGSRGGKRPPRDDGSTG